MIASGGLSEKARGEFPRANALHAFTFGALGSEEKTSLID
jgi:hypothetical protein